MTASQLQVVRQPMWQRRCGAVVAVLALVTLAGCGQRTTAAKHDHNRGNRAAFAQDGASVTAGPSNAPQPHAVVTSAAVIPNRGEAPRDALRAARAWALAAYSSSYRDTGPGSWTYRTRALVTGAEAAREEVAAAGSGGSTWAQIRDQRCALSLRGLRVTAPSDTPAGPGAQVVELTARAALSCASGLIQLRPLAAQLVLVNRAGRWLVSAVT